MSWKPSTSLRARLKERVCGVGSAARKARLQLHRKREGRDWVRLIICNGALKKSSGGSIQERPIQQMTMPEAAKAASITEGVPAYLTMRALSTRCGCGLFSGCR